ncbi:MAG: DUF371 domain-containing protein [Candidatus Thorarchaeota archaeon]|nr:MAG: DUF371 domain-containing protein [Candidatus Thorarchaeota archaeon]
MHRVQFQAYGHANVIGNHRTTVEITSESALTPRGTCIVGVRADMTLQSLDSQLKRLAKSPNTRIVLKLTVEDLVEEIEGRGDPRLTYSDLVSMVARKSSFVCGRTLMIEANKAASDLNRSLIERLKQPETAIDCELLFISE